MPQVDNLYPVEIDLVLLRHFGNFLFISQQDRLANTFDIGCFGCFEHIQVVRFRKNYPLGILACHFEQTANHLVV